MQQCFACSGFVPASLAACPHCQKAVRPQLALRFKRALQLVMGASITMTLAACYGTPPPLPQPDCEEPITETNPSEATPSVPGTAVTPAPCQPSPSPSASVEASPSPSPDTQV